MKVGVLEIELLASMARLQRDMNEAKRAVGGAMSHIEKSVAQAKAALGSLAAGFSAIAMVRKLVDVQREFDVLNSSLMTVTGSAAAAEKEFAWLKRFAAETPFGLAQATDGFVKMKALGLDPSEGALRSFGNTASAMGKSLEQMIEAVADASTSEFERLKEFGIKAKQQGDQVSLTFQGVTTTIGNNAAEITAYLKAIGENQFAGAMERRAKTLDGAIAELGDTWDELFRTISANNAGGLIQGSVRLATGAIEELTTILKALDSASGDAAAKLGTMDAVAEALAITFETIAVLGVNVKYVLVQIGKEIGGIAAQASAILSGDFSGAAAIRRAMVEDAVAARREIDELSDRILNARRRAREEAAAEGLVATEEGVGTPGGRSGPSEAELKAAQRAAEAADKYLKSLRDEREEIGLTADQLLMLRAAREAMTAPTEAQRKAIMAEALALLENRQAWEEQQKVEARAKESAEEYVRLIERMQGDTDNLRAQVEAQRDYNERLGMTREQLAALEAAKLDDAAASKDQAAALADLVDLSGELGGAYRAQAEELRELARLKREGAVKEAEIAEYERALNTAEARLEHFRDRVQDTLGDGLYDILDGNFRNIGDSFKRMILKMEADALAANLMSALSGHGWGNNLGFFGMAFKALGGLAGSAATSASYLADADMAAGLIPKFDGGGYTGNGSRSGGLDGKGGFLAMLHPQETVIDHTKGQSGAGRSATVTVTQTIHIDSRADRDAIMQDMARIKEATRAEIMDELRREGVV